jgi:cytochrome c-type biogenesis protein CcmH
LPAQAQDENVSDDEVNEVAKDIYCPVCESTPLDVCGTQACADWRELIREKLGEGQTQAEIFEYFARQYGDGVLANPPSRGVSLVILWVLPVVLILAGLLFFTRYMRTIRGQQTAVSPSNSAGALDGDPTKSAVEKSGKTDDDYYSRIEEELKKN